MLSKFLGRGTDAIECFLNGRVSVCIDINPASIALAQKNCSFAVAPDRVDRIKPYCRPTLVLGDARALEGGLFEDESFDLILSHPPYHRAIIYSMHLDGDLSRFADLDEFAVQMTRVARESYRLLKPGARCTLGIGDNREHCHVLPVGFRTIQSYMAAGFIIEELVAVFPCLLN